MKIVFALYRGKVWRKTIFHQVRISDEVFLTCDEKVSAVSWKLLSTCPEQSFAGWFRYILAFKIILDFGEKISAGFRFQSCFFNVHRNILKEMFSYAKKTYLLFIICGSWSEKTSKSVINFSAGLSKLHSTLPLESLWANQVSKKIHIFFHFHNLNDFFWQKIWGRVVKTVF